MKSQRELLSVRQQVHLVQVLAHASTLASTLASALARTDTAAAAAGAGISNAWRASCWHSAGRAKRT